MPTKNIPAAVMDALAAEGIRLDAKPLVIGGMAMEYYNLRLSGDDIDLLVPDGDYQRLATAHPQARKDIWGDLGVVLGPLEIWRSYNLLDYDAMAQGAIDAGPVRIISPERLLLTRAFFMDVEKYRRDFDLIVQYLERLHRSSYFLAACKPYADAYQRAGGTIYGGKYDQY